MDSRAHDEKTSRRNLRTGLVLGSIALAFFIGVIVKHLMFGS